MLVVFLDYLHPFTYVVENIFKVWNPCKKITFSFITYTTRPSISQIVIVKGIPFSYDICYKLLKTVS